MTMNHHPVHTNIDYAGKNQHGKILVVGTLVFSLAVGITVPDISGKAIYLKDMSSWKPTVQAGRDEQLAGQNHAHSSLNSTPQLAGHCYYPGDGRWLGCLCHWGESPGTCFFQSVPPGSES